jgi:transcriptional/translational regulatory protein YebC/TACO1
MFKGSEEEAALEALMMADVDVSDIESEGGNVTIFTPQTEYYKAKQALLDAFHGVIFEVDEIQFIPQTSVSLGEEDQIAFDNLVDMLEYLEDVQNVFHNAG